MRVEGSACRKFYGAAPMRLMLGIGFGLGLQAVHGAAVTLKNEHIRPSLRVRVRVRVAQAALTARSHHRIAIQAVQNKI